MPSKESKESKKECKLVCPPTLPVNFLVGNTAPQQGVVEIVNGTEANRLFRNAIASTCSTLKPCPGPFPAVVPFTALTFENPGRKSACVTITVTNLSEDFTLFSHAHAKKYDPNDICKNYLGDAGLSANVNVPSSYQIILPGGTKKFVVVVEGVIPNHLPAFGLLRISGLPCQSPTVVPLPPATTPAPALVKATTPATSSSTKSKSKSAPATSSGPVPGPENDLK